MTHQRLAACLALSGFLSACAFADIKTDRAAHATAVSCCSSERSLPAPLPYSDKVEAAFTSASPHFDFGQGLAPFVQINLDVGQTKYLTLLSSPRGSSVLLGGDGTFHYADLRPLFIAADGKRLPESVLTPPVMRSYGALGTYMYVRYTEVPADAASVIVASSAKDAGRRGDISGRVPGGGYMIGSTFIPMPGGNQRFPYTLSLYGELVLLLSSTSPK